VIGTRVAALLGTPVLGVAAVGGGMISKTYRISLFNGETVFAKSISDPPPGFFAAEANGLRWLREAKAAPLPEVLAVADDLLVTSWVLPGRASERGAEELGRQLASMHARGAHAFGAEWPGYIGSLPLDNTPHDDWPTFYAERRLLPYLRLAVDRGTLDAHGARAVEQVCARIDELAGPDEMPSRVHGDLWSGNLHWDARGTAWLIDPAAHGGHRETDLAMLALFPPPHLDRIIEAYDEVYPLADGWRERIGLHQLHPLLVHATLFGTSYGAHAAAVAGEIATRLA
jgi:fructosamine-3-kinase